MITDYTIFTEK